MKRTRKWQFVAQEAKRLADLGLTPREIATRIGEGVNRSTIQRWMAAGKIRDTRQGVRAQRLPPVHNVKPGEWAAAVRKEYQLDATDDQLVTLAETALSIALDPLQPAATRVAASGRFQSIAKQLALTARLADSGADPADKPATARATRELPPRPSVDPRKVLMAVK